MSGWKWLLVPLALVVGSAWGVMVAGWKEPAARPATPPTAQAPPPQAPPSRVAGMMPTPTPQPAPEPRPDLEQEMPKPPPIPPDFFKLPVADPKDGPVPPPVRVGQPIALEVLEALPGRVITGPRVVRPDGTITLGWYGNLRVAGLDRDQIKVRLIEHLRGFINDETLGLSKLDTETGKIVLVPPVQSNRVYVDDNPTPPAHARADGAGSEAAGLQERIEALEREVKALRSAQPQAGTAGSGPG